MSVSVGKSIEILPKHKIIFRWVKSYKIILLVIEYRLFQALRITTLYTTIDLSPQKHLTIRNHNFYLILCDCRAFESQIEWVYSGEVNIKIDLDLLIAFSLDLYLYELRLWLSGIEIGFEFCIKKWYFWVVFVRSNKHDMEDIDELS